MAAAEDAPGEMVGDVNDVPLAPPDDTGETVGLLPSRLTVTFGFGPGLFEKPGLRAGGKRPAALQPLPPLPGDELDPAESGGDICVQACSDDPQVAFHAIRNLARIGRGTVAMRWSQLGFGRTASTSRSQDTPRNLMGMKDGTANIRAEDTEAMERFVWVGGEGPAWMRGGSYMVTRRIRMLLEVWDRASLKTRSGRSAATSTAARRSAAADEFEPLPLDVERNGHPLIPADAHVRLASARRTAAPASSAAATPSPTASTRASASSKPGSSSSASSATPGSSSRSSDGSARWTRSTSTSSTSAAPSSRSRPAPRRRLRRRTTARLNQSRNKGDTHHMHRNLVRTVLGAGAAGLLALSAAACGSDEDDLAGAKALSFKLTDAGCDPHDAEAAAGPIGFEAENVGTADVTELEILEGEKILGEKENLTDRARRAASR